MSGNDPNRRGPIRAPTPPSIRKQLPQGRHPLHDRAREMGWLAMSSLLVGIGFVAFGLYLAWQDQHWLAWTASIAYGFHMIARARGLGAVSRWYRRQADEDEQHDT